MKHKYCTLFDSAYLSRGLALIDSLNLFDCDFSLLIFAMDDLTAQVLLSLRNPSLTVKLKTDLEDEELLSVKATRSIPEYFWTCTPKTILYALQVLKWDHCTYIDSDIYFFSDPTPLFRNIENILIVPHRFSTEFNRLEQSGKFCVQFNYFRNNDESLKVLTWWKNACIDWCFDRYENGKFGDQKYLDDWTDRFPGVLALTHEGGGLAPWNLAHYSIYGSSEKRNLEIKKNSTGEKWPVVFYHFHALKFYCKNRVQLGRFRLPLSVVKLIYTPYIKNLCFIEEGLIRNWAQKGYQTVPYNEKMGLRPWLSQIRDWLSGRRNVYKISQFVEDSTYLKASSAANKS